MSSPEDMTAPERVGRVVCADCTDYMRSMPAGVVDAVVTDPPYGLSFMGAGWDTFGRAAGGESVPERARKAREYASSHKGAPRYGNSHGKAPKASDMRAYQAAMAPVFAEALRVCKPGAHLACFGGARTFHRTACAIEDAGWEVRDCVMWVYGSGMPHGQDVGRMAARSYPQAASEWEGWNTQLKPAWEPIVLARKPLDGTVARNALVHGTGCLHVDACRTPEGRWPANLAHDGSQEVLGLFPESKGQRGAVKGDEPSRTGAHGIYNAYGPRTPNEPRGDAGSAARFFYCAKASRKERGEGNDHPTVKPLALMEWLVELVTREDALVLDPFAGSGTTLLAARNLGRDYIGIEKDPAYCAIAERRLEEGGLHD